MQWAIASLGSSGAVWLLAKWYCTAATLKLVGHMLLLLLLPRLMASVRPNQSQLGMMLPFACMRVAQLDKGRHWVVLTGQIRDADGLAGWLSTRLSLLKCRQTSTVRLHPYITWHPMPSPSMHVKAVPLLLQLKQKRLLGTSVQAITAEDMRRE